MRSRALKFGLVVSVGFVTAAAAQQAAFVYTPLGYQQIVPVPTGTTLTVPAASRAALLCAEAQIIRYRDDGTNPTATVGIPIAAGTCYFYSGNLVAIRFIQATSPATLDISYYR
jgi:hypothetical protein